MYIPINTVAISPVTGHPFSVAIGLAFSHVQTCHSRGAEVTVSVVSTTVQLTVESFVDLTTVGRTMMEASVTWPDSFCHGLAMQD